MQHEMPGDDFAAFGLAAYQGAPQPMAHYHRHHEIELNLVQRGSLSYLFSATMVSVPAGQLVVFWGVLPHRVVQVTPGTIFHWLTVPLGMFLQWRLPARLTRQVLSGFPICDQDTSRAMLDQALFEQWQRDLLTALPERQVIVQIEIEARLRRVALGITMPSTERAVGGERHVEQIARLIAERYAEPMHIRDLARAVGLHPHYAMQLFRKTFGMSLLEYLAQHRIAHAQRLLLTTNLPVAAVGLECGFGSASQFYAVFKRACGVAPGAYRAALAAPGARQKTQESP